MLIISVILLIKVTDFPTYKPLPEEKKLLWREEGVESFLGHLKDGGAFP